MLLKYRADVDGLRGLAVMGVVIFHAFPAALPGGFVGVDAFFAISGFIITSLIVRQAKDGGFSYADFLRRRARRILPTLLVMLFSVLMAGFFVLDPENYRLLARHAKAGSLFFSNFLLNSEINYFDLSAEAKPLLHLWSLSVEEQFYLVWPPLVLLLGRWRRLEVGLILIVSISFALNLHQTAGDARSAFFMPWNRFWELGAGGLLSLLPERSRARSEWPALLGLTLLLGSFALIDRNGAFPGWLAAIPVAGTLLCIDGGPESWLARKVLRRKAMVELGLVSYALYIWHWPLLSIAKLRLLDSLGPWLTFGLMVLALALAFATVRFVERPIRTAPPRQWTARLLGLLLFGVALAHVIDRDKGFEFRWSRPARAYLKNPNFHFFENIRRGVCHAEGDRSDHADVCYEKKRPLLALWGDSNAAVLYPGLADLQRTENFGIVQVTQGSCPPLFDLPSTIVRKNCNEVNERVLRELLESDPDVIVLGAAFTHHHYPMGMGEIARRLKESVARIRKNFPRARLLLFGPPVRWLRLLSQLVGTRMDRDGLSSPPERMWFGVDRARLELDRMLAEEARLMNLPYVSITDHFCNEEGCLTTLGARPEDLTASDDTHLSKPASIELIHEVAPRIFEMLR